VRRITAIVNPIAGTGARSGAGEARTRQARAGFAAHGIEADIRLTEGPGHAADLTRQAIAAGAPLVFAWGGDGTVNEIASVLAFTQTPLALIPAGSGNGLARSLGIPRPPVRAIAHALACEPRAIDVGELGGRLFFNVAGVGLDAHVARLFDERPANPRGFGSYVTIAFREIWRHTPIEYRVRLEADVLKGRADVLVLANGPEYGNGARIAPGAVVDDGWLDLVAVEARPAATNLLRAVRLMTGSFGGASGVRTRRCRHFTLTSTAPMDFHVDGQPVTGGQSLVGRVHPAALRVRWSTR